jgi:hypothetical protein
VIACSWAVRDRNRRRARQTRPAQAEGGAGAVDFPPRIKSEEAVRSERGHHSSSPVRGTTPATAAQPREVPGRGVRGGVCAALGSNPQLPTECCALEVLSLPPNHSPVDRGRGQQKYAARVSGYQKSMELRCMDTAVYQNEPRKQGRGGVQRRGGIHNAELYVHINTLPECSSRRGSPPLSQVSQLSPLIYPPGNVRYKFGRKRCVPTRGRRARAF